MHVAREWGVQRIYAETSNGNSRMLSIFSKRGFEITRDFAEGVVLVDKALR
jgi:hypothetical protein